jgi:hypothetical protein
MRILSIAYLVTALLFSASVEARPVKVGDTTLNVSPPSGFCEVDKSNRHDSSWLASVINLMNTTGVTVLAAFPDCNELAQMHKSSQFIQTKFYVTAAANAIGKSSSKTVSDTCDELRNREYSNDDKVRLTKATDEYANGNSNVEAKALGVLDETRGEVCYVATLQKVRTKTGDLSTMVALFIVTYIDDNLLFLYQYTPYVDASSMQSALANLKIIYSQFSTANRK